MASQLEAIVSWGAAGACLVAVAAAMGRAISGNPENPVPPHQRRELEDRYGEWAVRTALAVCPRGDVRCLEREAKRLYESRALRR